LSHSIHFFDAQFQHQATTDDLALNPFEEAALPHLRGRVLDFGCGMGNLAVAAARRGCSVVADLRHVEITEDFDAVASIGLLMFFDCKTAFRSLANLQAHVHEGGIAAINVLVEGTTYMDMFDPLDHCLFSHAALQQQFADWNILHTEFHDFAAPDNRLKSFATVIAQKPQRG
jgi:tellurite methyltransferase